MMNTPPHKDFEKLETETMTSDRNKWKRLIAKKFGENPSKDRRNGSRLRQMMPPMTTKTDRWFGTCLNACWVGPNP